MPRAQTFPRFDGNGEEATRFAMGLLDVFEITGVTPGPGGRSLIVTGHLAGAPSLNLNGGDRHQLSEAASIMVTTEDQAKSDRPSDAITTVGGAESMCGWAGQEASV